MMDKSKIILGSESADLHQRDLTESEDNFTVTNVLLSDNPMILSVKDLQVGSYKCHIIFLKFDYDITEDISKD